MVTHINKAGAQPCSYPATASITVLTNNGNWTAPNVGLTVSQVLELGSVCGGGECLPHEVTLAQMDADQLLDIVVADVTGYVLVALNGRPSAGSFELQPATQAGDPNPVQLNGIVAKDFDGNGFNDVACAALNDSKVITMGGTGTGAFSNDRDEWVIGGLGGFPAYDLDAARIITPSPGPDLMTCGVSDLFLEVTVLGFLRNISTPGNIVFDPQVRQINYLSGSDAFTGIKLAKFDQDNHWDVLAIREAISRLDTHFGDGAGNFEHLARDEYAVKQIHDCPAPNADFASLPGLDVGRINDTGAVKDVVVVSSKGQDYVHIYPGREDRDLEPERPEPGCPTPTQPPPFNFRIEPPNSPQDSAEGPVSVIIVDLNNDGYNDLVTTNRLSNNFTVLINANPPQ